MKTFLMKLWKDEEGAELVEWVIVVALIAAAAAGAFALLGPEIDAGINNITNQLPN